MKRSLVSDVRINKFSYFMLLPAFFYTLLFGYLTYPYVIIAFQQYNYAKGIFGSPFVGFENFMFFLRSNNAGSVILNTILLNLISIIFGTILSVSIAIILNEIRNLKFIKISQSAMLFPYYISWVVISYLLLTFLSTKNGIVNNFLADLGLEKINFYTSPQYWRPILVMLRMWKGAGMNAVIFLAAINGIDSEIYEAAVIDGASRLQGVKYLTVPLLLPTISILTLLSLGRIMYGDFSMIYAIVGDIGVLYRTTDIIDTYVFRILRQSGNPSQSMAIGLFQSVLGFILVYITNRVVKTFFDDGALF